MSDNSFIVSCIAAIFLGVVAIISVLGYVDYIKQRQMIEGGYIQQQVPQTYATQWVRGDSK